ncbi:MULTISPECIES: hypothetical protein [Chryseobacterium]|nr:MULTISPECIES: hypothetical protein [Chryseobacterium]
MMKMGTVEKIFDDTDVRMEVGSWKLEAGGWRMEVIAGFREIEI